MLNLRTLSEFFLIGFFAVFVQIIMLFSEEHVLAQRVISNVDKQFGRIAHHGDSIGWHLGVAEDPDQCRHYQGVVRQNAPDGTPYLLITRSGNHTGHPFCTGKGSCGLKSCPGELIVVRLGSRDRHGERLRTNKYRGGISMDDTAPPYSRLWCC